MNTPSWKALVAASAMALTVAVPRAGAQVITTDFTTGASGGFTTANLVNGGNSWILAAASGWSINGVSNVSNQRLLSPVLTATGTSWGFIFDHRYTFENTFDGGQVLMSVNGGAFTLLPSAQYSGTISPNFDSPIGGQVAFTGTSSGYATPAFLTASFSGATTAGTTFQFAFNGAWDNSTQSDVNPDWQIRRAEFRDFTVGGLSTVPEPSTYMLMAGGLLALAVVGRRRRTT